MSFPESSTPTDAADELLRPEEERKSSARRLISGFSWNMGGQFLVVGIGLGLTPFLLHKLGAVQYGIFAFASSLRGFLSNIDAGLAPTGYRYFPIYVGAGDVSATTNLLLTFVCLTMLVVGAIALGLFVLAPVLVKLFSVGSGLSAHAHEVTYAVRALMPALLLAAVRTPVQRLVMAHHRWSFVNLSQVIAMATYASVAVVLANVSSGLQCLVWATYAQEALLTVMTLWACRRYVSLRGARWVPADEVRRILRFGRRVQVAAFASSLNFEVNTLLVGALFPIRDVAYYSVGANFSQQVLSLPINGLYPILQDVGRTYGAQGEQGVLRSFAALQVTWVRALGAFPALAALIGWFGIPVWLGHGSSIGAASAAILVIGSAPLLFNSIVDVTAKVVERPEIESWYLGLGVALSLVCAIPLLLTIGILGIPIGTAIGQSVSVVVCIRLVRRRISDRIHSFIGDMNLGLIGLVTAFGALILWLFSHSLPEGAAGLVGCGVLVLPAFAAYYLWTYRSFISKWLRDGPLQAAER